MKSLYRWLLGLLLMLATLLLMSCGGSYGCRVTFGSSTCTPSGSGIGSGGGGGGGGSGGGGGGGGGSSSATVFAYVIDQGLSGAGSLDGYGLNPASSTFGNITTYTPPTLPVNNGGIGVVVAQGQFVYAVFPEVAIQSIYGWSISKTGSLALLPNFPMTVSLTGISQIGFNQQVVITNPQGTLLLISEFADETILAYNISNTGALTVAPGSPFNTLPTLEPQNMSMDGLGKYLYVTEDSGDHEGTFILGYSVSPASATSVLTPIPNTGNWENNVPAWQLVGDPDGLFMIGTTGKTNSIVGTDDDNLYVYKINTTTNPGALAPVAAPAAFPFPTTYAPFNLAMQPTSTGGEYVYSFSLNEIGTGYNAVEGFSLDPATGGLTKLSGSPFVGLPVGIWGQFDQSGNYLFVYGGTTPDFTMGVLDVNAGGGLGVTTSTVPLKTSGYWGVADVPTN
jgi:hypothetical protein